MTINPYIAGNPVGGGEAFIGRADVLREVVRVLRRPNENALVLHGQRRIGKTSVLQELLVRLPGEGPYCPVFFDLQDKVAFPLSQILSQLAGNIGEKVELSPPFAWDEQAPKMFRETFIPQVLANLPAGTSLVFLFDEFDVLDNPTHSQMEATFFSYLRDLLSLNHPRLQFVFVIGCPPEQLSPPILRVIRSMRYCLISLMPLDEMDKVVHLAEHNRTLRWSQEAIAYVFALTSGHPLLTQQLCQEIWDMAYRNVPEVLPYIQPRDVEIAIPIALRSVTNSLEWLWDGFNLAQRVVASTLAKTTSSSLVTQNELNMRLLESIVQFSPEEIYDALRLLQEWDLIERIQDGYCFRVELLRRWIVERKLPARIQASYDFAKYQHKEKYNIPAMRKLLRATFSDEEFSIFCYDYFQEVYEKFSSEMSLSAKIQLLIDYCVKRVLLKDLLFQVKMYNPSQYLQFEKHILQIN